MQLRQGLRRHSRGGDRAGVNAGNSAAIGFHGQAKGENSIRKGPKVVSAGEEFQHPAHMGKRRLKRGEGLGRGNGGGNSVRVQPGHGIGIGFHPFSEGEQTVCEGLQVVASGEEGYHPADIGKGGLQLCQRLCRSGGSGDRFAVHAGHAVGISLHRLSKGNQLIAEGLQIVVAREECDQTSGIRNGICQLHQSFSGNGRVRNRVAIQTADRF